MSKMAEMDMMVQEVVEAVRANNGSVLVECQKVAKEWALSVEEFGMVFDTAMTRVYPPTV